jgi:steroid delta-isomerase-like uncharacterized protein
VIHDVHVRFIAIHCRCGSICQEDSPMSAELQTKIRRLIDECWNQGDLDALDELYSADIVHHKPPYQAIFGRAALKRFTADTRSSYPDIHLTIDEAAIAENITTIRWTFHGTLAGQSPTTGVPGIGKHVTFTGCTVSHWMDGKIVEEWEHADYLGLLQQLGVLPLSKQVGA